MKHAVFASVFAVVAVSAAARTAAADPNLWLDTRMVGVDAKLTEQQCLDRGKAAIAELLKGNKNVDAHAGQHTWIASTPDVVFQVECLQYNKVNGAYVVAAGNAKQKGAGDVLAKATEAIAKALKAP